MIKEMFQVVVVAGGLATRLRPLTETIPKSLVEINGEPFVAHQLRFLHRKGIRQVVMCLGYLGDMIVDYVGDGSRFGLRVSYVFDGEKLLGTAGAIKRALPLLDENFFVLNGDSYLPCDYRAVQESFICSQKKALMTVFYNQGKWDSSNVEFKDNRIIIYDKINKTPQMLHIDYGLEVFNKMAFSWVPENEVCDLTSVYQALLKENELAAFEVTERFYENGSFAGIKELAMYLDQQNLIEVPIL